MKTHQNLKYIIETRFKKAWSGAGLTFLVLAAGVGVSRASSLEANSFDNAAQVSLFAYQNWNGTPAATNVWVPDDSQGLPWSGSMQVTIGYSKTDQGGVFLYYFPQPTNISAYTAEEMDVKVSSTGLDANNNNSAFQPGIFTTVGANADIYNAPYMTLQTVTTNDGWQHLIIPVSQLGGTGWTNASGIFFQIADYNETSNVTATLEIDNVQFTSSGPDFPNFTNATFQFNDPTTVASIYGDQNQSWYGNTTTVTWSTNDSKGYTNSGSMYVVADMANGNNIILGVPFDTNYSAFYGATDTNACINLLQYTNIEMDVLWDTNASTMEIDAFNAAGDIGGFPVGALYNPGAGQAEVCGSDTTFLPDAASNSWQHIVLPITSDSITENQTIGLWFKKYWSGGPTGTETATAAFWVDNITFDGAVVPPKTAAYPTVSIAKTVPGIQLQWTGGTGGNSEYAREHLATGAGTYSFVGASSPVTYSVTYASFPPEVPPQDYACIDFDPGSGAATEEDWTDPTLFRIQLVRNTNVSGFGSPNGSLITLQCKTNSSNANGDLYDASDPSWTNVSSPNGTWSFTISGNTNILITAPDGETKNLPFPLSLTSAQVADPGLFGTGTMWVYFGGQGNGAAGQGERLVMTACSISGGGLTGFNENFAAEAAAGDPGPQGTVATPLGAGQTWTPVIAGTGANPITWYVGDDTTETYPIVQNGAAGTLSRSLYLIGASTPLTVNWTGNVGPGFQVLTNTSITGPWGTNTDLTTGAYLDATFYSADVSADDLPPVGGPNWFVELAQ